MAKDRTLYKEISDVFGGYNPLTLFEKGVLYINSGTIVSQPNEVEKTMKLLDLVNNGPECWGLQAIELGDKPEKVDLNYVGVYNPA